MGRVAHTTSADNMVYRYPRFEALGFMGTPDRSPVHHIIKGPFALLVCCIFGSERTLDNITYIKNIHFIDNTVFSYNVARGTYMYIILSRPLRRPIRIGTLNWCVLQTGHS